jgi:ubiquinone/menaquinone biosynthesis C-methylase UbiE
LSTKETAGRLDERLKQLNRLADEAGWLPAIQRTFANEPGLINYVTNERRLKLLEILPLGPETDVLEIGPGMGQFTVGIARKAKTVHALEISPGQAEFVEKRCRQEGLENVNVSVGGAQCVLPFPDASFDTVVMNLVLEWCAEESGEANAVSAQNRMLREICRVLRPGGCAFISTKNRYALRYLIGMPDEHLYGIPFGSALPRAVQQMALRLNGHAKARGRLHSYRPLSEMIDAAGFGQTKWLIAAPDIRYPTAFVDTDGQSVAAARSSGMEFGDSKRSRILLSIVPAGLVKYLAQGLTVLAFKTAGNLPDRS